ncbi:MAG: hypothetical protein ACRYGP_04180 [Janthinobacterium lividum]
MVGYTSAASAPLTITPKEQRLGDGVDHSPRAAAGARVAAHPRAAVMLSVIVVEAGAAAETDDLRTLPRPCRPTSGATLREDPPFALWPHMFPHTGQAPHVVGRGNRASTGLFAMTPSFSTRTSTSTSACGVGIGEVNEAPTMVSGPVPVMLSNREGEDASD